MKIILIIFVTLFFFSCGTSQQKSDELTSQDKNKQDDVYVGVVDVTNTGPRLSVPDVDVGGAKIYDTAAMKGETRRDRVPVLAMVFGPGLFRIVGHLSLLRELKQEEIKINIVSGTGLGAFVAAFFALGMTSEKMEWVFYNFFRETVNDVPFSKSWRNKAEELLIRHIDNKELIISNILLAVPVFDKISRKHVYMTRGDFKSYLLKNLEIEIGDGGDYASAFMFGPFYNPSFFRGKGADIVMGIDVLGTSVNLVSLNEYLFGSLSRISSIMGKQSKSLDLYYAVNLGDGPLDARESIPMYNQLGQEARVAFMKEIKEKIQKWREGLDKEVTE